MRILSILIFSFLTSMLLAQDTGYVCQTLNVISLPMGKLNTKSIEFSPIYYQTGIVYVVARERNSILDPKTGQAYFDLMYADLGPDGLGDKPVFFSPNIRTQYHEGPCTFNKEQNEIFFTRSNIAGGTVVNDEKGDVQLKIYHAVKGTEDWEQIEELPFCSDSYSVAHPALSADGRYLVFSSNMPGGSGDMDLYFVERISEGWSTPVNLGPSINSKGNEVFPYFHTDGYLFFSSDGRGGKGGLDLFVTAFSSDKTFKGLQHLPAPFNSGRDDLGMIVSDDGTSGYFGSDRKPTTGKDDLYRWNSPVSIFCSPMVPVVDLRDLLVTDQSGDALDQAHVWLIPMDKEGPSLYKEHFNTDLVPNEDKEGTFFLRWGIQDTLSFETSDAITNETGRTQLKVDNKLNYAIVVQRSEYIPFVKVMKGDEIPAYIRLAQVPIAPEKCLNTLFTVYNEKGDVALNGANIMLSGPCVKVDLNIYTDPDGKISVCLPVGCKIKAEIQKQGYAMHTFTFSPTEENEHWIINLKDAAGLTAPTAPIATGTVIVLDNIYYDFNKSEIRKGDAEELISLADILNKYPDLTIELTSHTDTRGTAEYNLELSKRRSESSKSYLVSRGISASRIVTKAAGETTPRNHCTDGVSCTEAEHQYNRRTEVRIINPAQGMEVRYKATE
ncbi:MAG TPA: OmpA family protein [Saprospiraceae bacterium]|nr:OmpA family protein [Saprospiraceae bacterium]